MTNDELRLEAAKRRSTTRFWIATALTILLVIAVWKFIDYWTQPPPPPHPIAPATP